MTIKQISKILDNHGIEYKIENNNIYGLLVYTKDLKVSYEYENLTNYTLKNIRFWLGY